MNSCRMGYLCPFIEWLIDWLIHFFFLNMIDPASFFHPSWHGPAGLVNHVNDVCVFWFSLSQPHIQATAKFCRLFLLQSPQARAHLPTSAPVPLLHGTVVVHSLCQYPWDSQRLHPPWDCKSHKERESVSLLTAVSSDTSTGWAQSRCPSGHSQG